MAGERFAAGGWVPGGPSPIEAGPAGFQLTAEQARSVGLAPSENDHVLVLHVEKLLHVELDEWQRVLLASMLAQHRRGF